MDVQKETVEFENEIAYYDERGWGIIPLVLLRKGSNDKALVVNVKFSNTLNDTAPGAMRPLYSDAVEVQWNAGESGHKEVPLRVKIGSVQNKSLLLEAVLEVPLGQNAEIPKGKSQVPVVIVNEFTSRYPDRSNEYLPMRTSNSSSTNIAPVPVIETLIIPNISNFSPPNS
jgi:hypothetical protein